MNKIAFITGITGQDGSYLAELLLNKGYHVHGLKRKSSSFNTNRIDHLVENDEVPYNNFYLHYGDLSDNASLIKLIDQIKPNEIYNLGAQSHVATSFEIPEYTADINGLGELRILEAIRYLKLNDYVKFYQASSSELFGKVLETPQNENTPFYPQSPYAVAKLFAYWITINYRESFGIYACNGILFNHESARRGETFVTRKITRGLSLIALGLSNEIYLGNLDAKRDWGHAKDYVKMQWMMLQNEIPRDYVIATGKQYSVREFIIFACEFLGISIRFENTGLDEVGIVSSNNCSYAKNLKVGDVIIRIDERYFRPSEVDTLLGDFNLAREELGWEPKVGIKELVKDMMLNDLNLLKGQ